MDFIGYILSAGLVLLLAGLQGFLGKVVEARLQYWFPQLLPKVDKSKPWDGYLFARAMDWARRHGRIEKMDEDERKGYNKGVVLGMLEVACAVDEALDEDSKTVPLSSLFAGKVHPRTFMTLRGRVNEKLLGAYQETQKVMKGKEPELKHWKNAKASFQNPEPTDDNEND